MIENKSGTGALEALCLALYIGLVPLNCVTLVGIGSIYKFVALGVAAILLLIVLRHGMVSFNSGIALWGLYIFYMGISVLWAENMGNSWNYFMGMLQVFAISLLFLQWEYSEKQHEWFKRMIVLSGLVFFALQISYSSQQIYTGRNIISFGTLGGIDPNEFCGYLILPIAVCMQMFFDQNSGIKKILSIFVVGLLMYSIMSAGSRGGLLAAVVTIVVVIMKSGRFSAKKLFSIIGLIVVGTVLFIYVIIPNLSETLLNRFSLEGFKSYGGSGRFDIWLDTLKMLWNNPLRLFFGCGVFGATSVPYCSHNMIIQVLLDNGIVGLILYIFFMVKLIQNLKSKEIYVRAAFWGIQTSMLTLSAYAWFTAINKMAEKYDMPILYSCHPRSRNRLAASGFRLDKRVIQHEPLGFHDYNCLQMNAFAVVSDSGTLPEESSFFTSIGHPFPAVCIRTSTERPEALDKACFILSGIDEKGLLQSVDTAVEMNRAGDYGIPVPDYIEENVSSKVVKIIQSYTGVVNKMVWRKDQ